MAIQRAKTMTILFRFWPCTISYKGKFKQHYWVWGQHTPKGGKISFLLKNQIPIKGEKSLTTKLNLPFYVTSSPQTNFFYFTPCLTL